MNSLKEKKCVDSAQSKAKNNPKKPNLQGRNISGGNRGEPSKRLLKLLLTLVIIIKKVVKPFPPNGKCMVRKNDALHTYTSGSNGGELAPLMDCDASQKSFQFMVWIKLSSDVPSGQLWFFFRYHTDINLYFKPLGGGDHALLLTKFDESPIELGEVPVGKSQKWIFVWLQITATKASLAVRSTENWELETNRIYHYPFSN